MWRMLQQPELDDYVVATGAAHSVQQFVELAFPKWCARWWKRIAARWASAWFWRDATLNLQGWTRWKA
jgi:hypothetical protein